MARQPRAGFWEERVFPFFGYYPWECAYCRIKKLMRDRGIRVRVKKRSTEGAETRS